MANQLGYPGDFADFANAAFASSNAAKDAQQLTQTITQHHARRTQATEKTNDERALDQRAKLTSGTWQQQLDDSKRGASAIGSVSFSLSTLNARRSKVGAAAAAAAGEYRANAQLQRDVLIARTS